jgi:glycosyltransferase involved in cell wall biosynthesis
MKALVVAHAHPAFSIGGAQVAAYNLHEGLRRRPGWSSHFLAAVGRPVAPHSDTPLMNLGRGPDETLFWSDAFDWSRLAVPDLDGLTDHFERFLRDLRPDVVNFHHVMGFGVQALRSARRALGDTPVVLTLHEYLPICANHGQMIRPRTGALCEAASPSACGMCFPDVGAGAMLRRELFLKSFLSEVDAFVGPSRFLLDRYEAWGLPPERLAMLENGLDGGPVAPPRPLPEPGARRNRFAFFGQLNPFKGVRVLIDAVTRIPADRWGPDGVLYVFGGNLEHQPEEFQREVRELFRAAGRRVRFMGSYKSADLPGLMRAVDWVVVPSTWWENAPVVIQEAFHHGRPVIASDIGGMREKVRDGVDGLHFQTGNPESLAERMAAAIEDRGLWGRLRARIVPPCDADAAAARHAALFELLIARARGAPAETGPDAASGADRPDGWARPDAEADADAREQIGA